MPRKYSVKRGGKRSRQTGGVYPALPRNDEPAADDVGAQFGRVIGHAGKAYGDAKAYGLDVFNRGRRKAKDAYERAQERAAGAVPALGPFGGRRTRRSRGGRRTRISRGGRRTKRRYPKKGKKSHSMKKKRGGHPFHGALKLF